MTIGLADFADTASDPQRCFNRKYDPRCSADLAASILGIELLCAAQARELHSEVRAGTGATAVRNFLRTKVEPLQEYRFLGTIPSHRHKLVFTFLLFTLTTTSSSSNSMEYAKCVCMNMKSRIFFRAAMCLFK